MPLMNGKSPKAFSKNVSTEMNAGKPQNQALAIAYSMKRKAAAKKMAEGGVASHEHSETCMSEGGSCYAMGGEVENEKLHPEMEVSAPEGMLEDEEVMEDEGDDESEDARHYADGGMIAEIMKERKMKRMASGGMVSEPVEDDFDTRINMEPVHTMEDEEHGVESGSLDDESLVGQILRERKMRRRG